jgi:hypothetical protein
MKLKYILTLVGIVFLVQAFQLDPGSIDDIGPGFFPIVLSILMIIMSLFC